MLKRRLRVRLAALLATASLALSTAPAADLTELEAIRAQFKQLQESFERLQREHNEQIAALRAQIERLATNQLVTVTNPANTANPAEAEQKKLELELARELAGPATNQASSVKQPADAWNPASPAQVRTGSAYMDLGLVATFAVGSSTASDIEGGTQLGGHDPTQQGFTMQGLELSLSGAVDPYFRGNANVLFQVDSSGESIVEVEEAWLETVALPGGLQLRAGQIMTEFGRHNPTHVHAWAFVDAPLVTGRFFGPDGLRNLGVRLSWLVPTPFFSELQLSVQNSHGETAHSFRSAGIVGMREDAAPFAYRQAEHDRGVHGAEDLLYVPRYAVSFDPSDTQVLLLGASAAFGPNSSGSEGAGTRTEIYGIDATWKWKPINQHGGFPFLAFQTEAMVRRYEAGAFDWENFSGDSIPVQEPATGASAAFKRETLVDYGFYAQALYGFRKGWVVGLRFDWVTGDRGDYERMPVLYGDEVLSRDSERAERWRFSPNLTWYPTEFSKLRIQYNLDDRQLEGFDHSVWLQVEFLLGAHAAHKF